MSFTKDELEHLASEDLGQTSKITHELYCGNCGYSLRTLPYTYSCPECGNEYSARPTAMRGVYQPGKTSFPVGDVATVLLCAAIAVVLLGVGKSTRDVLTLALGTGFVLLGVVAVIRAVRQVAEYWHARSIQTRVDQQEE